MTEQEKKAILQAVFGAQQLPPLCLSLEKLKKILLPICTGYTWAEDTIQDLWLMGAPQPPRIYGTAVVVERLIVPSQLATWLEDVLNRMGRPMDLAAKLYTQGMRF